MNRRSVDALFPPRPALLIIDMQHYFVHPRGGAFLPGSREALQRALALRDVFRERDLPVVFTRHAHRSVESAGVMDRWWGELIMEGTWESELAEELEPTDGEPVIRKERYSAYRGTDLEDHLKANRCDGVVVCGVMTHLCVETTARESFIRDYLTVIAADACASDSVDHHMGSLDNLAHGFALILGVEDIMELLG